MKKSTTVIALTSALLLLLAGPARAEQAADGAAKPPDTAAQAPSIARQIFPDATTGQPVSVSGANLSGRKAVVKLRSGANQDVVPVDIRVEDRAVVFVVPEKTSGRHNVYVSIDGEADTLAGRLDIVGVAPAVRRVTAISPAGQGGVGDLLQRELNASAARGGASRSGPDEEAVFVRSFERAA